jgi:hypothetical protein
MGETNIMVNILSALGDRNYHCDKAFLNSESKAFIKMIRNFPLRWI